MSCPQCKENCLSRDNPYGMVICQNCGWLSQVVEPTQSKLNRFKKNLKVFGSVLLVIFFALASIQFIVWKNYSFQASWLLAKAYFVSNPEQSFLELGAVCNSLENYNCSERMFRRVVELNPKNRPALANLAIVLAMTEQWKKALPHFNAYFSLGGNGYDVVYWYGRTVAKTEGVEEGLKWYYSALVQNPSYEEAAQFLIDELVKLDRLEEAESVIGSITAGQPDSRRRWQGVLKTIAEKVDRNGRHPSSVTFPSILGSLYFVPVRLMKKGRVHFFTVSTISDYVTMSADLLDENLITIPEKAQPVTMDAFSGIQSADKIILPRIQVGPWLFENVEVLVCEACDNTIGKPILSRFHLDSWKKNKVEFTLFERRNIQ